MKWSATTGASAFTFPSWLVASVYGASREDDGGTAGVREPRRPVQPFDTSGASVAYYRHGDTPPLYKTIIG